MASTHLNQSPLIARLIRWTGYGLSFFVGATLWPQLMEWGYHLRNDQFGIAMLFNWFCLPVTMTVAWCVGWVTMHIAAQFDDLDGRQYVGRYVHMASTLGIVATLGSCSMIASGYEPPEPLRGFYDLDLSGKYR